MSRSPAPIESLIKFAGVRDQPSVAAMSRAREAARAAWRQSLSSKPESPAADSRKHVWPLALAAAVGLVAVVFVIFLWQAAPSPAIVARVAYVEGEVRAEGASEGLVAAAPLRSGEMLSTREGRVALRFGDTLALRVGRHSTLRFEGIGHVTLLAGDLYLDSGGLNQGPALRIATPEGEVRHVGTQFQVQVRDRFTRVQVREGRVVMTMNGGRALDLAAGDLAELGGGHFLIQRDRPSHGEAWEWTVMPNLGFDIENRPLSEFLAWLTREHGWQLRYSGSATPARAREIRLHGSMQGLDTAAMLERLAMITGLELTVREGVLWVEGSAS